MTKTRKRRKLYHFHNLLDDKINFIESTSVANIATKQRGVRYVLSDPLTKAQRDKLNTYDNVVIGTAQYRYAPEIKYDTLILLD